MSRVSASWCFPPRHGQPRAQGRPQDWCQREQGPLGMLGILRACRPPWTSWLRAGSLRLARCFCTQQTWLQPRHPSRDPDATRMRLPGRPLGGDLGNAQRAPVPARTRSPTPPPDGLLLTHCHQGQTELWSRTCPQSTAVLHPAERHWPNLPSLSGDYALSSERGCRVELTRS